MALIGNSCLTLIRFSGFVLSGSGAYRFETELRERFPELHDPDFESE